jgi:hypothetical protein
MGGCAPAACAVAVGGPARSASGPGATAEIAFGRGPARPVTRRGPPPGLAVRAAPAGRPGAAARTARPGSSGPARLITRARSLAAACSGRAVVSARRAISRTPRVLADVTRARLSGCAAAGRRPWRAVLGLPGRPTTGTPAGGAGPAVLGCARAAALGRAPRRGPAAAAGATRGLGPARPRVARGSCPARRPRVPVARAPALGRPGSLSHVHQPPALTLPRQAKRAARPYRERPSSKHVRRRPTLPRGPPRSTIGAEGLNFRVRNGTGCFPFAITAETLLRCHRPSRRPAMATVSREPHSGREIKWSRSQATRPISTGQLHTLPCFHLRPINPVV